MRENNHILAALQFKIISGITDFYIFPALWMVNSRIFYNAVRSEYCSYSDIVRTVVIFNFLYQLGFPVSKFHAVNIKPVFKVPIWYPTCHYHFHIWQVLKIRVGANKTNCIIPYNARCCPWCHTFHSVSDCFYIPVLAIFKCSGSAFRKHSIQ